MSERDTQLFELAERQIAELLALISTGGEPLLRRPCPRREKLGHGTVAAVASHIANTYQRIAAFIRGEGEGEYERAAARYHQANSQNIPLHQLLEELSAAQRGLSSLADLTDEHLDTVPPPDAARFCDGKRTLEQVLAGMLNHPGHQVDAVRAATA